MGPWASPDRSLIRMCQASYDQACRSKLSDIAQTRTRQAVNIQEQLRNPPPPQMNMMQPQIQMQGTPSGHNPLQFQFTGNANPQLQPPMQASGLPLPQPFMHQQPQLPMGGQQIGMQHVSHGPHPQLPPNPSYQLTVEDNQTIQRMAHNLAISTPSDQLDIIRSNLENMQPDQRQFLAQQNIDPMTYFFRNHATRKFLEQKARMAGQRAPHDVNLSGNGIMPQPPRAPPQMQSHPGHPSQVPPSQMVDPSFGGNMDQIRGQQEDALRSQEAGQVVVPASQQRGNVRNTPHPQPNALLGGSQVLQNLNQALPVAAQYWGTPQIPQGHMQPGQPPAQPQTATFVNMSTPTQLQGQVGGLNSHMGRMPHQTPNMPNLNKGLKDSPQTQNRWHNQPPPPNQPPGQAALGVPQPKPQPGVSLEMDANQQRQMNHRLANMPPDQRREILMNMQRRQRPASQANAHVPESATAKPPENQAGQQIPVQDVSSTPMMNNADGAHDPAMPQQPPAIAVPGPQQAQSQRSQHVARQNAQVAHLANILTEEQAQQMDQREFPITILNHAVTLSHLPPNIKTWGQLKGWISQKNNELPPGVLGKIRLLQVLHFQNLAKQNNPAQQIPQSSTSNVPGLIRPSAPTAPMVPARNNGQPFQAGNGPGVAQGPRIMGGPPVPQPTVQEIQACRARLPDHLHGLTDEQISIMIFRQRQDLIKSQAQHPLSMQHMSNPNRQRVYPPNMPPQQFPAPNNQPIPLVQPAHRPQHQQTPRPAGNMAKEQQPKQPSANRNLPQTQNQGQSKGTKRSSSDDVVEVANPSSIRKETQVHPTQAQTSAQSKAKVHHNIPDQSAAVHPAKHPVKAEQGVPTHPTAPDFQSQPSTQDARSRTQLDAEQRKRLQQLATETAQSMPARQPISMSPEIKAKMTQKLRDARAMVQRLDHALPIFFRLFGDETIAKDLIRIVSLTLAVL